jgi:hypothetical protein
LDLRTSTALETESTVYTVLIIGIQKYLSREIIFLNGNEIVREEDFVRIFNRACAAAFLNNLWGPGIEYE